MKIQQGKSLRILVADDMEDITDSMALLLHILGHIVQVAHDGLAAVERAAEFQPDVVLLDIGMPGINGYEAARRIRQQRGMGVVLIAVTAWGSDSDKREAMRAGFDHHLTKPVNVDALIQLLLGVKPR